MVKRIAYFVFCALLLLLISLQEATIQSQRAVIHKLRIGIERPADRDATMTVPEQGG